MKKSRKIQKVKPGEGFSYKGKNHNSYSKYLKKRGGVKINEV
jgi:hypothetical protein